MEGHIAIKNMSEEDCKKIAELCGAHNLTVTELVESFLSDLTYGTQTNGSDERLYAKAWFNRCYPQLMCEETLLKAIIEDPYEIFTVEEFLENYDEQKLYKSDPEKYAEELEDMCELEVLEEYMKEHPDISIEDEIGKIREYVEDYRKLRGCE